MLLPVATVVSFFARETQEGMGFPFEEDYELSDSADDSGAIDGGESGDGKKKKATVLQIIK